MSYFNDNDEEVPNFRDIENTISDFLVNLESEGMIPALVDDLCSDLLDMLALEIEGLSNVASNRIKLTVIFHLLKDTSIVRWNSAFNTLDAAVLRLTHTDLIREIATRKRKRISQLSHQEAKIISSVKTKFLDASVKVPNVLIEEQTIPVENQETRFETLRPAERERISLRLSQSRLQVEYSEQDQGRQVMLPPIIDMPSISAGDYTVPNINVPDISEIEVAEPRPDVTCTTGPEGTAPIRSIELEAQVRAPFSGFHTPALLLDATVPEPVLPPPHPLPEPVPQPAVEERPPLISPFTLPGQNGPTGTPSPDILQILAPVSPTLQNSRRRQRNVSGPVIDANTTINNYANRAIELTRRQRDGNESRLDLFLPKHYQAFLNSNNLFITPGYSSSLFKETRARVLLKMYKRNLRTEAVSHYDDLRAPHRNEPERNPPAVEPQMTIPQPDISELSITVEENLNRYKAQGAPAAALISVADISEPAPPFVPNQSSNLHENNLPTSTPMAQAAVDPFCGLPIRHLNVVDDPSMSLATVQPLDSSMAIPTVQPIHPSMPIATEQPVDLFEPITTVQPLASTTAGLPIDQVDILANTAIPSNLDIPQDPNLQDSVAIPPELQLEPPTYIETSILRNFTGISDIQNMVSVQNMEIDEPAMQSLLPPICNVVPESPEGISPLPMALANVTMPPIQTEVPTIEAIPAEVPQTLDTGAQENLERERREFTPQHYDPPREELRKEEYVLNQLRSTCMSTLSDEVEINQLIDDEENVSDKLVLITTLLRLNDKGIVSFVIEE